MDASTQGVWHMYYMVVLSIDGFYDGHELYHEVTTKKKRKSCGVDCRIQCHIFSSKLGILEKFSRLRSGCGKGVSESP